MDATEPPRWSDAALAALAADIKGWAGELGFGRVGVADVDLSLAQPHLTAWLQRGFHGEMHYMARHGTLRSQPAELVPGTVRVIAVGMDYLPDASAAWVKAGWTLLDSPARTNVSVYARGRDYHKLMRGRLKRLAARIADAIGPFGHRVFTDSAPILEVELARKAGLGWRGKHTLMLARDAGSMFFLGEIFIDVPLPVDALSEAHCGRCTRCIDVCPTRAIVAPYVLDARRCISYLTIELPGSIPEEFRPLIGNRVYGCDDCQLVCPWNKFAQSTRVDGFQSRGLEELALVDVFSWDEQTFLDRTAGSAIRRIGHERWLRNVAVALGNALRAATSPAAQDVLASALLRRLASASELVREHVVWALQQAPDPARRVIGASARSQKP